MMKKNFLLAGIGIGVSALLPSCIDDAYDLDGMDTTVHVKVDNLTVPINIDEIKLNNVIDIDDEDSNFKKMVINGKEVYAFTQHGDFHSDPIHIAKVTAAAPDIEPTNGILYKAPELPVDFSAQYPIEGIDPVEFSFNFDNVDKAIHDVYSIQAEPIVFTIKMSVPENVSNIEKIGFQNLIFTLPKGMDATATHGGIYNPEDGTLFVKRMEGQPDDMVIKVTSTNFNFNDNGAHLDYASHSFKYIDYFKVLGGDLLITLKSGVYESQLDFRIEYSVSKIVATSVEGDVEYNVDGINIDPISLSDIPDFLTGDETNILLDNPQIYLNLNNPVAPYSLNCQSGFEIQPVRNGQAGPVYGLNDNTFKIPFTDGEGPYNFCFAPSEKDANPSDFYAKDMRYVAYTDLSKVVGEGPIPESLNVTLNNPQIPLQYTTAFPLGTDISAVNGNWEFLAPLNLQSGSQILYSDTTDDFGSDFFNDLTIQKLNISAIASSDFPCRVKLMIDPLDEYGNIIPSVKVYTIDPDGNTIDGSLVLPQKASDYAVDYNITGDITGLSALRYKAYIIADETTGDLSPNFAVSLQKIRATVTGFYDKEL